MRKVIYAISVSLDGYIEAANGDIGWSFPDEELHKHFNERESMFDTHLYGRRLYENMTAYWPTADENPSAPQHEIEYARIWKSKPKVVFSKTLDHAEWNSTLIREDITNEVNRLKSQSGKDMSVGGAELASTFMRLSLIDEYWLYIHPIILGGGKHVFQQFEGKHSLRLIETYTFSSGVVLLRYQN
jgi:dihydrofolate reductase